MTVYFATTNKHKLQEAQAVLGGFDITVERLAVEKNEDGEDIKTIASREAKRIATMINKPVIVDDTGVFFDSLDNFPGHKPKRIFEEISYDGLFRALEGKQRKAHFECCVAFCKPQQEPVLFCGKLIGEITHQVHDQDKDVLPYERIFRLEDGRMVSSLSREEKNAISHRAKAFRKLGEFLSSSNR